MKKRNNLMLLLLIFILSMLLVSCATPTTADTTASAPSISEPTSKESETEEAGREVVYAPEFELEDLDGNIVKLVDLKGKNVLLNFWATWCPFCIDEMPDLQLLYEKYKDDNFIVLAVNVQESAEKARSYLEETGIELPVLLDKDSRIAALYGANSIPLTIVINKDGVAVTGYKGRMTIEQMETIYEMLVESNH
ncbi:MAG: Alkyl hydroperoxide reductase/ Thiol specific antioxidant/ Mal allergen [Clostridiales bacterium 38_11]|nr:MAG: Alkyl hydroperoxide reductase/ Thiol specific antioxidant/ Mal allergen [Clostridiales bacterium 38_11]HBH11624.1 thiol-disulfide oxidoreductase [Clostridiales bacterium]